MRAGRRKQWWFQQMSPRRTWLLAFGLFFSCAFTYITFYETGKIHAASHRHRFPLSVLGWLKPEDSGFDDKNVLHKDFDFVIKVLAYDRLESLRRCLRSLAVADYGGDRVDLVVLVDHFRVGSSSTQRRLLSAFNSSADLDGEESGAEEGLIDSLDLEPEVEIEEVGFSSDPLERSLQQAHQMMRFLDKFRWSHGSKQVHYRTRNVGLQAQWIEAWWPASDNQFALIVEDDMELSPLYYRYARSIIANYYYDPANFDPSVFGITLQRPRFVPGKGGNQIELEVKNNTRLFLYQMVGSWGQILFPKPWKEFLLWFDEHKAKGIEPLLEGMVTTGWYKRLGDKIWTPWFTKFVHDRGYFNIYTNLLKRRALSVSHRSQGVNYRKDAGPDSRLIRRRGVSDIDLWEMPALSTLNWYDFCFHLVLRNRLVNASERLQDLLMGLLQSDHDEVVLVSIVGVEEAVVRNWLCQLSALGTSSYFIVGTDQKLSKDLARRGHPVMLIEQQEDDDDYGGSLRVLQQTLELGYSTWFARPDVSWMKYPLLSSTGQIHRRKAKEDLLAVTVGDEFHSGLFFITCNYNSRLLVKKVEEGGSRSWKALGNDLRKAALSLELAAGDLEGVFVVRRNATVPSAEAKVVLFEEIEDAPKRFKAAELWLLDEELACKRVSCKPVATD